MQITHKETGSTKYTVDNNGNIERVENTFQTTLANGNIQARLRMIYLYNLASIHKGLVMDTDNLTENNLGYFTIHGDVGDFNPIGGLWKTEVFKLAEWLFNKYKNNDHTYLTKAEAVWASLQLKPTAGLGITNNDLEEIGAESYDQVDTVLQDLLAWKWREFMFAWEDTEYQLEDYLKEHTVKDIPQEIIERVAKRHFASEFKRKQLPIKITRGEIG
jgi:NAD+ synthetase